VRVDRATIYVLLVEPRDVRRKAICDLFSQNMPGSFELHLAQSYSDVLSMVQGRNYDVCLAPSRIDEHDVMEMLSEIAGGGWKIPVIILTSSTGSDEQSSGDFLGQHIHYAMERNRLEAAITRAKKEWEHIFDAVPDPIAILDRNHLFRRVNKAMAARLGTKPGDLIGRACYEVVHGLPSPPDFCPMSQMLEDGEEHCAEIFEKNLNGVFQISVSPFLDDESNLSGGIHVARDITQLKAIEEKLRDSNEKLEQHVTMRTSQLVQKAKDLEEANIALKVLLKHRELDRVEIEESVTIGIKEMVAPHLDRMEHGNLSKEQLGACIREIRNAFEDGVSPFMQFLSGKGLSPTEIRVAEMIRAGKINKEIADSISISEGTVRTHRERIRNKLGLTNQKTNLCSYLQAHQ
jgi:PAS domain S-box-containing protein